MSAAHNTPPHPGRDHVEIEIDEPIVNVLRGGRDTRLTFYRDGVAVTLTAAPEYRYERYRDVEGDDD